MSKTFKPIVEVPTLRDYFAVNLPSDEIQDLTYKNLSRIAQEALVGRKFPQEMPSENGPHRFGHSAEDVVKLHLAKLDWWADVNAALRYKLADAMLRAREAK